MYSLYCSVLYICLRKTGNKLEPAGVSGTVTISDQKSYIKIETLQNSTVHRVKFVVSSQWTVVQFLIGLTVFVVVV